MITIHLTVWQLVGAWTAIGSVKLVTLVLAALAKRP